jgi:pre-rRNA-processing protein TSR3
MSKFSWGDSFWKLNKPLIERYMTCTTSEDIEAMQERIQEDLEQEARERKADGEFLVHLREVGERLMCSA